MATEKKNAPDLSKKTEVEESSPEEQPVQVPEKYVEVYFLDKTHDDDLEYHYLAVNGEALQITKGSTVIIPERFLEVARHATYKNYKKGKCVGEVSRVPYRVIRDNATEAEYLKMKNEGTKKHMAELESKSRAASKDIDV